MAVLGFVFEIGTHLEEAAVASILIVTVGGYLGAWGGSRGRRRRVDEFSFNGPERDDGRDASGRAAAKPD
jgi:hypothetical protein